MTWLRSKWLWLVACVVIGALVVTIASVQSLQLVMAVADALSSGTREGMESAGLTSFPRESRRFSVSFLCGLVEINDTPYPYLWTVISGIVTGGGLGAMAWGLAQIVALALRSALQRSRSAARRG